jgi:O-antigen/teichoic acid export membrane protein
MSLRAMSWAALPFGMFLFTYPDAWLGMLFGGQFLEAADTMRVLAFSPAFAFLNAIVFNRLLAADQQRMSAALAGGAAGLNFFLNLPLIARYGGPGAAVATLIAYGAVPIAACVFKETREIGRMALASLIRPTVSALTALTFVWWLDLDAFRGVLVLSLVYLAGLIATRELGSAEMQILRKAVGWEVRGPALT